MISLIIVVEGETEVEFVTNVLAPYLRRRGVDPTPMPLRGGVQVESVALNMANAAASPSCDCVTSLVDFYGFTKKGNATIDELQRTIDKETDRRLRQRGVTRQRQRVFSYIQKCEFESLLFSDVSVFSRVIIGLPKEAEENLQRIRSEFAPEDINDNKETAPSKRIQNMTKGYGVRYSKPTYGPLLAQEIGLDKIRAECPRFDRWVRKLEGLGNL